MDFDVLDFERSVPKGLIEFYLEQMKIEADKRSLVSMYHSLNEANSEIVQELFSEYCYAGRTAVNIFKELTLPPQFMTKEKMIHILRSELDVEDIFNREFRPSLTEDPKINWVEDRGETLLIQFVSKGRDRRIRNGYNILDVSSINFECAIIHFTGPTIIELRCPYNQHQKYLKRFEDFFRKESNDGDSIDFDWIPLTKVSNAEAEEIARKLSAGLVEADHKDDGIYDRHMVTASPKIRDLREQEDYITQFKNKMLLSQSLLIDYQYQTPYGSYDAEIKFKINLNTGLQFLSKVSEAVIEYVIAVFLDVHNDSLQDRSPESSLETV